MNKQELCQHLQKELGLHYNPHEINNLANYFRFNLPNTQESEFSNTGSWRDYSWISVWIARLKAGEPIQYIAGVAPFLNLNLTISNQVLIPRPETEEMAQKIYLENKTRKGLKILDVGSGSGCISLYLKHMKSDWIVFGVDVSPEAIECSSHNATRLNLDVHYLLTDFLNENLAQDWTWDMIISNPPYIHKSESLQMDQKVLKYEPEIALFAPGSDALIFYRKIAEFGGKHLSAGGIIYVEMNEFKADEIELIFRKMNYSTITIYHDYLNKPRILKCTK